MTWWAAGAAVGGALIGSAASRSASSQQSDASQRALEAQSAQYDQSRADLQPWVKSGSLANNKLSSLMGLDGSNPTAVLQSTPGYQFRYDEGMRGVENSAASRGGLLSGGTMKAIQKYGQDFASGEYQNAFNRLNSMSTTGQNSAANQAARSESFGNAAATQYNNQGSAQASGSMGQANAWSNGINTALNGYQNNQMMDLWSQKNKLGKYAE